MTRILTYTNKKGGFSRKVDDSENIADKKKGKLVFSDEARVFAEQELDELIKEGWQILSSSTYTTDSSVMGSTIMLLTHLTLVLYKKD